MKLILPVFAVSLFLSNNVLACQQTAMSNHEVTNAAEAVYVGGVMGIAIPELTKENMNPDLNYPNNIQRSDRVVTMKVFQTLSGENQETLDVTLNWCNGQQAKLGEMAIVYKLKDGWYLKHDAFAVSETAAILSTQSQNNVSTLALH